MAGLDVAVRGTVVGVADATAEFERLFRAEYGRVVAIADRVLADTAAAEDVAQDVFLSFNGRHAPTAPWAPAWLHRAAAHAALNAVRGRARRVRRETPETLGPAAPADPAETALAAEERAAVRAALARLPERSATLLVLRYSGLSYAEVAAALGIGVNQIGTLLRRAEAAFKKEVGDAGL